MNILILSWRSPGHPNAGGAEQVTLEHAKGWVKAGHSVVWFSSQFEKGEIQETIDGVIIIRKGGYVFGVRWQAVLWYFFGKHPKFDLVIDEFHGIPFFTPLFVKGRKLAFIHEVAKEVWKYNPWPRPINLLPKYVGVFVEPWIFKLFYKEVPFLTVSNSTKDDLIKFEIPKSNIFVIQNGVKLVLPSKMPNKEIKKTAIYLGAISEDKGTYDAVRAFARIERKDDNWQYWIVGFGTKVYVDSLKKLAEELGVNKKIIFFGQVSDKKKFELLARAHVLINPSKHEGWGLVNIEANSVGVPVVGYDVHGLKDSIKIGKTGILVQRGDYQSLAEEAINLVNEKDKYEKFKKEAINWSKKFTWDKSKAASLELIESI